MKVLYVAAEAAPIVKHGGLGDVAGSLPQALRRMGVEIRIALPWYPEIDVSKWNVQERGGVGETRLGEVEVPVYLLGRETFSQTLREGSTLSLAEEEGLFTRFSESVIELIKKSDWKPTILHGNDWHSSRAMALSELAAGNELREWGYMEEEKLTTVFTIHNLGYFSASLRQAILTADIINTVSPSYAKEILLPENGQGLHQELNQRKDDLFGVLNGIDYGIWNPEGDTHLPFQYGSKSWQEGKGRNKSALMSALGLEASEHILLGFVGRLDPRQKGVELLVDAMDSIVGFGCRLVILGTGDPAVEEALRGAGRRHTGTVSANINYDEQLAHRIYAGADALLIPSRYEPCGLIQMIAMRYGTLPIAHAVGGLQDTIKDGNTGFLYRDYSLLGLVGAVERAQRIYRDEPHHWAQMIQAAMQEDFSWDKSAQEYVKLYEKAMGKSLG